MPHPRILLIEDSADDRGLVLHALKRSSQLSGSLTIDEAPDMQEALLLLTQHSYDCALVDLGLPDGQGVENVVRLNSVAPDMALIVLSGVADRETIGSAMHAGVRRYLVKGVDIDAETLAREVDAVLQSASAEEAAPASGGGESGDTAAPLAELQYTENINGVVVEWSPICEALLGRSTDAVLYCPGDSLLPQERQAEFHLLRQRLREGHAVHGVQIEYLHGKTGERIPVRLNGLRGADAATLVWQLEDMNLAQRAGDYERVLRSLMDTSRDAIISVDLSGTVVRWNRAATKLYGYEPNEVIGQPLSQLTPEHRAGPDEHLRRAIFRGESLNGHETERVHRDGHKILVSVSVAPLRDGRGSLIGWTSCEHDISARVLAQRRMAESERMAELGRQMGGFTHEVSTPMGVALMASTLLPTLMEKLAASSAGVDQKVLADINEACQLITANLQTADQVVGAYKAVAADQASFQPRRIVVGAYIEQIVLNLRPRLKTVKQRIEVNSSTEIAVTTVPGALAQIIGNLIHNSLKHAFAPDEPGRIEILVSLEGAERWRLEYRDDGRGIPAENLESVWHQFFTTARDKGGTGIGLDVVRRLTTQLNGEVSLHSTQGEGVCFEFLFPMAETEFAVDCLPSHTVHS